jgi:hypothetical protein
MTEYFDLSNNPLTNKPGSRDKNTLEKEAKDIYNRMIIATHDPLKNIHKIFKRGYPNQFVTDENIFNRIIITEQEFVNLYIDLLGVNGK